MNLIRALLIALPGLGMAWGSGAAESGAEGNQIPHHNIQSSFKSSTVFASNTISILAIRKLLVAKDFQKLNSILAAYQKDFEKDFRTEDKLFDAYDAFAVNDPRYEALLSEWVNRYSDSYQPYLARASYFDKLAWKRRGTKWASETSKEQFEGMEAYFSKVKQDLEKVLRIKQDILIPYSVMMGIYRASGSREEVKAVASKALKISPYSFKIRSQYLLSLAPRWGGSYEDMGDFAKESQKYSPMNPKLKTLEGFVYYDAGRAQGGKKNYGAALELFNEALSFGELAMFFERRADAYQDLDKLDEALKDINRAIEIKPQDADLYYRRSQILGGQNMLREALQDIEVAEQLEPNDERILEQKKWIADSLVYSGHTLQKNKNPQAAIEDYDAALRADPSSAYAYYRRARTFIDQNDLTSALDDLKKSVELGPKEFDTYLLLDWVLAKQSDWDTIVSYWSKYISLEPGNGRAYVERGGAYYRKGDLESAVKDAKEAMDLGNIEGKQAYERFGGQVRK